MIADIGHVAYATNDLERSLAFYARLGIKESFRLHREDGSILLVYLHVAGDRFIEIFPVGWEPERSRRSSYMHLCLIVDDMETTVERLTESGVVMDRKPETGMDHNIQAWIGDPDGNAIELMQIMDASPQWKAARGGTD